MFDCAIMALVNSIKWLICFLTLSGIESAQYELVESPMSQGRGITLGIKCVDEGQAGLRFPDLLSMLAQRVPLMKADFSLVEKECVEQESMLSFVFESCAQNEKYSVRYKVIENKGVLQSMRYDALEGFVFKIDVCRSEGLISNLDLYIQQGEHLHAPAILFTDVHGLDWCSAILVRRNGTPIELLVNKVGSHKNAENLLWCLPESGNMLWRFVVCDDGSYVDIVWRPAEREALLDCWMPFDHKKYKFSLEGMQFLSVEPRFERCNDGMVTEYKGHLNPEADGTDIIVKPLDDRPECFEKANLQLIEILYRLGNVWGGIFLTARKNISSRQILFQIDNSRGLYRQSIFAVDDIGENVVSGRYWTLKDGIYQLVLPGGVEIQVGPTSAGRFSIQICSRQVAGEFTELEWPVSALNVQNLDQSQGDLLSSAKHVTLLPFREENKSRLCPGVRSALRISLYKTQHLMLKLVYKGGNARPSYSEIFRCARPALLPNPLSLHYVCEGNTTLVNFPPVGAIPFDNTGFACPPLTISLHGARKVSLLFDDRENFCYMGDIIDRGGNTPVVMGKMSLTGQSFRLLRFECIIQDVFEKKQRAFSVQFGLRPSKIPFLSQEDQVGRVKICDTQGGVGLAWDEVRAHLKKRGDGCTFFWYYRGQSYSKDFEHDLDTFICCLEKREFSRLLIKLKDRKGIAHGIVMCPDASYQLMRFFDGGVIEKLFAQSEGFEYKAMKEILPHISLKGVCHHASDCVDRKPPVAHMRDVLQCPQGEGCRQNNRLEMQCMSGASHPLVQQDYSSSQSMCAQVTQWHGHQGTYDPSHPPAPPPFQSVCEETQWQHCPPHPPQYIHSPPLQSVCEGTQWQYYPPHPPVQYIHSPPFQSVCEGAQWQHYPLHPPVQYVHAPLQPLSEQVTQWYGQPGVSYNHLVPYNTYPSQQCWIGAPNPAPLDVPPGQNALVHPVGALQYYSGPTMQYF